MALNIKTETLQHLWIYDGWSFVCILPRRYPYSNRRTISHFFVYLFAIHFYVYIHFHWVHNDTQLSLNLGSPVTLYRIRIYFIHNQWKSTKKTHSNCASFSSNLIFDFTFLYLKIPWFAPATIINTHSRYDVIYDYYLL